jgi:hypothetical protein
VIARTFAAVAVLLVSSPCWAQQRVGTLEPIRAAEFLQLPEDAQAVYVGGIMEGMAFVLYGQSHPDYAEWVACVRRKTLGDTTKDVIAFIKSDPKFDEGVASAFAQTMGKRCDHPKPAQ